MSPRAFKSSIDSHLKQFSGFKQHDAQEFLTAVLDRLHDEVKSNIVIDKYNLSDEFQEYMIKKVSLFNQINSETIPESDKQHFQMQLTQFLQENIAKEIGAREVVGDDKIAKVSLVGVGMRSHAGVASQMFGTLAKENINIQMISTSEIKISVVVEEKYMELAVRALHTAFGLDA